MFFGNGEIEPTEERLLVDQDEKVYRHPFDLQLKFDKPYSRFYVELQSESVVNTDFLKGKS